MKVILTGSTGFIGSEILSQCLSNVTITSVIVLSRRDFPAALKEAHPKLKVIVMDDFLHYSEDTIRELEGAHACIWALGKAVVSSDDEARKISFGYTLAAVKALDQASAQSGGRKLRFTYLSGTIAERDQTKRLWYMQEHRRIRGQLETDLVNFASERHDTFEIYIIKPSMVLSKQVSWLELVCSLLIPTVKVDVLARTMIEVATRGHQLQTFENRDISCH